MQRIIRSIFVLFLLGFFTVASAQLPPKIMADKHLLHAEQLYDAKNYAEAFSVMGKIIALQQEHSLTLSDDFHFKYAQIALSVDSTRIASGTSAIDHPLNGQSCVIRQRANAGSTSFGTRLRRNW